MALSIKEAQKQGLLSAQKAKSLRAEMDVQAKKITQRLSLAAGAALFPNQAKGKSGEDPQRKIFDALEKAYPGIAMWEVEGLVPGRKYRCDIYLPESRVVVEMDGYGPHRSKEQFQSDRVKRNLLASTGYIVLAYYYAQVKNDIDGVIAQILATHNLYRPFMTELFKAQLAASVIELSN
ncbi:endonuclease domain-containing protein [Cellvibrio sp. QJXJ]|uniref:endonuclease domain-containing protein n=1 Tax=Cellvibrio sp. QJXJ TaxID=2964606 RepID=UPI0021C2C579|nr:endonuclease domain-containing protein [Cellvibrio sp. QJXJ]UUA75260.1 endonuclease domain-containing protein [Cellvibrio sp. QJXJ]